MSLDPKNGALITRPSTSYWQSTLQLITAPTIQTYQFTTSAISASIEAIQSLSSYVFSFFRTNSTPDISISEKSVKDLHASQSLQGDSLTKQLQRDATSISVTVCGNKQKSIQELRQSIEKIVNSSIKPKNESNLEERVLRICQQSIFQPGFEALQKKLEESHIVIQETALPLEVDITHDSKTNAIAAQGQCGVKMYPTTDWDLIDQVKPKVCMLEFRIFDVFSNDMRCRLKDVPAIEVKKRQ